MLTKEQAEELTKGKRFKPEATQINGTFLILNVDWNKQPHQITLKRIEDDKIVKANFELTWLSDDAKNIMQRAEWKEDGNKVFEANINARVAKDGRIITADLVKVQSVGAGQ